MIENTDQRSKDYSEIKDKFRPSHADYTYFEKYGIRNIFVPIPDEWVKKSISEAKEDSLLFKNDRLNNRLKSLIGEYTIDLVK